VAGTILASVPDNAEGGSYLTFAFPVILFCVIAAVLYVLLFSRPHRRVPTRRIALATHAGPPSPEAPPAVPAATTTTGSVSGEPSETGAAAQSATEGTAPGEGTGSSEGTASTEGTEASE
jgi:hypothetical protein